MGGLGGIESGAGGAGLAGGGFAILEDLCGRWKKVLSVCHGLESKKSTRKPHGNVPAQNGSFNCFTKTMYSDINPQYTLFECSVLCIDVCSHVKVIEGLAVDLYFHEIEPDQSYSNFQVASNVH